MAESARIQDIQERVRDFTGALRLAGAPELAQRIERHAAGFIDTGQVRRSVAAIQQQLQYFRSNPEELPDLPIVQVAANRLEDVCREALSAGLIEAARPSLRTHSKRKLGVIAKTLVLSGLALGVPVGLTMLGLDWNDLPARRTTDLTRIAQGSEQTVSVNVLAPALEPAAVSGVEIYPKGRCPDDLGAGLRCRSAEPREFGGVERPCFEIMLPDQAYGVFVAFGEGKLLGAVASATVLLAATWETPEGRYELPLEAAFHGYSPERCSWLERLQDQCEPPRVGPGAKHEHLPVPTLLLDVVRPDASQAALARQKREAQAEAERAAALARADRLAGSVVEIKAELDRTQVMLRKKQWELVRERTDKLSELFSPLDALVVSGGGGDALPAELASLRARFEDQRRQLQAFEDRAFDSVFAALQGDGDEAKLVELARKLRISPSYLDAIIAAHAEQLETRLREAEAAQRQERDAAQHAIERKCGELPTKAFREVNAYLGAMSRSVRAKTELRECLTPRLNDKTCWAVVCSFDEVVSGELTDKRRPHRWTFFLRAGRVTEHSERVVD